MFPATCTHRVFIPSRHSTLEFSQQALASQALTSLGLFPFMALPTSLAHLYLSHPGFYPPFWDLPPPMFFVPWLSGIAHLGACPLPHSFALKTSSLMPFPWGFQMPLLYPCWAWTPFSFNHHSLDQIGLATPDTAL